MGFGEGGRVYRRGALSLLTDAMAAVCRPLRTGHMLPVLYLAKALCGKNASESSKVAEAVFAGAAACVDRSLRLGITLLL